jgi:hypothetical protein
LPEPHGWLALLAGLGLLGVLTRSRAPRDGMRLLLVLAFAAGPVAAPSQAAVSVKGQAGLPDFESGTSVEGYGWSIAPLGDVGGDAAPGDGSSDLIVGQDDDLGGGTFFIQFLNEHEQRIGHEIWSGNHNGFGRAVVNLGDIDGDGNTDLLFGSALFGEGGQVELTSIGPDGRQVGPRSVLQSGGNMIGFAVASLGDIDGDGTIETAIGQTGDSGTERGDVWLRSLDPQTRSFVTSTLFDEGDGIPIQGGDRFGISLAALGDLDGPGGSDAALAVGAMGANDADPSCGHGTNGAGAVYVLSSRWTPRECSA